MQILRRDELNTPNPHVTAGDAKIEGEADRRAAFELIGGAAARMTVIRFGPGSLTRWHVHEGGQILHVLGGRGVVETKDGLVELFPGDTVICPAGERHRHGAHSSSELLQMAYSLGRTTWE